MSGVITYAKTGVANNEGVAYVKSPSKFDSPVDKLSPTITKTVSYIAASGLWYDRFDDITYYG